MILQLKLDPIDLTILRTIANNPTIKTREIQEVISLSRVQVLRRLERLTNAGLISRTDGIPGRAYRYSLIPGVEPENLEQVGSTRLVQTHNVDPVAREALRILIQELAQIAERYVDSLVTNG